MARVLMYNELCAVAKQVDETTEVASPATADVLQIIDMAIRKNEAQLLRTDKGLGRSRFGFVRGGNTEADWELNAHLTLKAAAAPVSNPQLENILLGAMGGTPVSVNTTVNDAGATAGSFIVASATGIQIGDILAVNIASAGSYQCRPVTNVVSTTITFSPPFTAAPTNGATVKARIYRLSTALPWFTIVNWLRNDADADSVYSQKAIGSQINELEINTNQNIVQMTARGLAASVSRTSIPSIPSLPSFAEDAVARNYGGVWYDATAIKAYEMLLRLNNGVARLPVPVGQQAADGVVPGQRTVSFDLLVDGDTAVNTALQTAAENKTDFKLFGCVGQTAGESLAWNLRTANLILNPYEKGAETLRLSFAGSQGFASAANNELVLMVA